MTELQKARADLIRALERNMALERENESLRRRLFETQSAAIKAVAQIRVAAVAAVASAWARL